MSEAGAALSFAPFAGVEDESRSCAAAAVRFSPALSAPARPSAAHPPASNAAAAASTATPRESTVRMFLSPFRRDQQSELLFLSIVTPFAARAALLSGLGPLEGAKPQMTHLIISKPALRIGN